MLTDKWIAVQKLTSDELPAEFDFIARRCLICNFTQPKYERFIQRYLSYAAARYDLDQLEFFVDSTLKDPIYAFTTDNKIVFSMKLFMKNSPTELFLAINYIEHELAHQFERKNSPPDYQKFTNEQGKQQCYNYALAFDFLKQVFKRSNLEQSILTLRQVTYATAQNEIYARNTAINQMQLLCDNMAVIMKNAVYRTSANKKNYFLYEQLLENCKEQEIAIANKSQAFLQSENYKNLLTAWNNFIDNFTKNRIKYSSFTGRPLINFVNAHLSDVNDLLGNKYLFSQNNIDKMFEYYINQHNLGYYKLAYKLTELPLNENSKTQLAQIYQNLQTSPINYAKFHTYALKEAKKSKLIPPSELNFLFNKYEQNQSRE